MVSTALNFIPFQSLRALALSPAFPLSWQINSFGPDFRHVQMSLKQLLTALQSSLLAISLALSPALPSAEFSLHPSLHPLRKLSPVTSWCQGADICIARFPSPWTCLIVLVVIPPLRCPYDHLAQI